MLKRALVLLMIVLGIAALAWKGFLYRHHLRFVPEEMGVWRIIYVAEEAWGFGPGGNETGIIVYDMPEATYDALQAGGIKWLQNLSSNNWSGWQGRYDEWHSTPVPETETWADPARCSTGLSDFYSITQHPTCPSIAAYMAKYGFWIPLDAEIELLANEAVFSSGAYFSHGRIGMLIVIPEKRRLIYAYNG